MNAGAVDLKVFQEVRAACRREVGATPESQTAGNRHGSKPAVIEHMDIRSPTDSPIQAFLAKPIVVARRDENWDWMSAFELDTQKLAGVRRHALVLKQIATAADDVDALVNGKL